MKKEYLDLYRKKEFFELIDILELSEYPDEIWLLIDCYLELNDSENAIRTLENNRSILFNDNPIKTMSINIDLFLDTYDFVHALKALDYYENLPYVSMEVEERLSELKDLIYSKMEKKEEKCESDDLLKHLDSYKENKEKFLRSLLLIEKDKNFDLFVPRLKEILVDEAIDDLTKTFILILFVEKKYMETVKMVKGNVVYEVIPYTIDPIPSYEEIDTILNENLEEKDVTILKTLNRLVAYYAILIYPNDLKFDEEIETLYALYAIASEMCGNSREYVSDIIKTKKLNLELIEKLIEKISGRLEMTND